MNIRQLRYFYEIANEKQITRAAKKLYIAQPPLSQSLKALEEELNVKLFERHHREMILTEAGKVLYQKTEALFHKIDDIKNEVKETNEGIRGTIAIGCNRSCFSHIPNKIKIFQEKYPEVRFKLLEGDSYFLTKQLIDREIEAAIVRLPTDMNEFNIHYLPTEEYVAVISNKWIEKNQAFQLNKTITIKELEKIPLILLHRIRGKGQFEIILDKFTEMNLQPEIICESPNVDMVLGLVSEGLGATILPKSTLLKHELWNVKVLKLENINIISESAIIWLKNRYLSKNTRNFISLFTDK